MAEKQKNEAPDTQAEVPQPAKGGGKGFGKIAAMAGVAVAIQTAVLVVWLGGFGGQAEPTDNEHSVDPVDVEFGNYEVANIYFTMPMARFQSDGATVSAGLEKQVALAVVIRYRADRAEQAIRELDAQAPWIKQEVRRVIRQEEDPIKVLNQEERTKQRIRETLMLRIRQRIGDETKKLLVGQEVIFSSFNISG